MARPNRTKALTATINRLVRRFDAKATDSDEIAHGAATIRVTTSATVAEAVAQLAQRPGPVYVALTNREGVRDALRVADGTKVGVMQPDGVIVRPAKE